VIKRSTAITTVLLRKAARLSRTTNTLGAQEAKRFWKSTKLFPGRNADVLTSEVRIIKATKA